MEQSLNLCLRWFAQGCISSCSSTALNNASSEISSNHFSLKKEGTRTKRTMKQVENKEKKTKKTERRYPTTSSTPSSPHPWR